MHKRNLNVTQFPTSFVALNDDIVNDDGDTLTASSAPTFVDPFVKRRRRRAPRPIVDDDNATTTATTPPATTTRAKRSWNAFGNGNLAAESTSPAVSTSTAPTLSELGKRRRRGLAASNDSECDAAEVDEVADGVEQLAVDDANESLRSSIGDDVAPDVQLDEPGLQLIPYERPFWQQWQRERASPTLSMPKLIDLTGRLPVFTDGAALEEPPSPWSLMPIGGHGRVDGTQRFFALLNQARRVSIVRVVSDESTPLEVLQSIDCTSPTFSQACSFLNEHSFDFSDLNLNLGYDESSTTASRQLVASSNGASSTALWPAAAAFNSETFELVVLVAQNRNRFAWKKVIEAFF